MEEVLIDTDIFIEIFRGDDDLRAELANFHRFTSAIVYIELIQGDTTSRKEITQIKQFLGNTRLLHITESISSQGVALVEEYGPSQGLKLADALICCNSIRI